MPNRRIHSEMLLLFLLQSTYLPTLQTKEREEQYSERNIGEYWTFH